MIQIAIDIGGTFTDIVCLEDETRLHLVRVPTAPQELVQGVRGGVEKILQLSGHRPEEVTRFIHSTTIATNAILEQKGAALGLLMSEGFEEGRGIGREKGR